MSTPSQGNNAQAPAASGSTGPSTPAAATTLAPSTVAALAKNNVSTPQSNPSTKHPSPAAHYRSPGTARSPAAIRSVGATPMARAASTNTVGNAPGSQPMRRGHTTGMKGLGTSGKSGKTVAGAAAGASGSTSSPAQNQSSPMASMTPGTAVAHSLASFESPAMAGSASGIDMSLSLSNLGINMGTGLSRTGSAAARVDEEERRRRLEAVLATLRKKSGRISREAIERLGRRYELDMQMDEDELSLAGKNAVMLEIYFKPNKSPFVERVSVAFPTASDAMAAHVDKASRILQDDLTPPSDVGAINASLDKFADNLERLARLDKLSIPGANCFEAVFGVYTSLKRLYEHEKSAVESLQSTGVDDSEYDPETRVMCTGCGRPRMHARRRVGLLLEYWKPRSIISRSGGKSRENDNAMDVDGEKIEQKELEPEDSDDGIASVVIECESSSPALYQTIRITDDWISERVEKPPDDGETHDIATIADENGKIIEWLDPPAPLIRAVEPDPMSDNAVPAPTQPQARFVAKFEPPVVLPLQLAAQIYGLVNVDTMHETIAPATIDTLLLPSISQNQPTNLPGEPRHVGTTRAVTAIDAAGESTEQTWALALYLPRLDAAVQIDRLPFSHPRQLVAMLPVLRQYMFIAKLLQNTFTTVETPTAASSEPAMVNGTAASNGHGTFTDNTGTEADPWAFLAAPPAQAPPRRLDVTLSTDPAPRITVSIPSSAGVKHVAFSIGPNGAVEVDAQDVVLADDDNMQGEEVAAQQAERAKAALKRALLVAEDLGVWAEWVRGRFLE